MAEHFNITFDSGEVWRVPVRPLAEARADYYSGEVDGCPRGTSAWQRAVEYAIRESYEAEDWARNNMDWADLIKAGAVKVKDPEPVNYQAGLPNAEWEAI